MTNMSYACLRIRCRQALDWGHPTFLQASQLWALLTSQLGVTARWPHPSTQAPPDSSPSGLFQRKKSCCCIPPPSPPSPILQHKSFSFSRRKLFWPRPSLPCWQYTQFQPHFKDLSHSHDVTCYHSDHRLSSFLREAILCQIGCF